MYHPDEEPKNRKSPEFLVGINQLLRKEKTTYSAGDMWIEEDDRLFLKYCEDPLIKLYHKMSRDFSNRPHELLNIRIGKIVEGIDSEGKKYATTSIGAGGKTNQHKVALYHSYPDYIEYLQKYHPTSTDPNSFIFKKRDVKSRYQNVPISRCTLTVYYWKLRHTFFPKLLNDPQTINKRYKHYYENLGIHTCAVILLYLKKPCHLK